MAPSTSSIGSAQSGWPPGARLGRYELLAKVAAGGMAEVYVGRVPSELGFSRLLALKVLHQSLVHEGQFISMFLDEARLAARIRHPNVVSTVDVGRADDGAPFLVMEYIEGDHFGQLLGAAGKRGERVPLTVTLRIVCDALAGLGAAHALRDEQGKWLKLVHRDVSPQNIIVGCDGVARLSDFGIAKAEDRLTHTREGQVKGKLAYMAPEQASSGTTDGRSDLFAMGIVLWEAVVGRRLFRAEHAGSLLHKILNVDTPLPSTLDPALAPLDSVLELALHRDPEQRFQDADAFHDALEQAAMAFGGLASRRQVGATVRQLAAAKLERDRQLISAVSGPQNPALASRPRPTAADFRADLDALEPPASTTQVGSPAARRRKSSGKRPTATHGPELHFDDHSTELESDQPEPESGSLAMQAGDATAPPSHAIAPSAPTALAPPTALPNGVDGVDEVDGVDGVDAPLQTPSTFRFGKRATVLVLGLLAFGALLVVGQNEKSPEAIKSEASKPEAIKPEAIKPEASKPEADKNASIAPDPAAQDSAPAPAVAPPSPVEVELTPPEPILEPTLNSPPAPSPPAQTVRVGRPPGAQSNQQPTERLQPLALPAPTNPIEAKPKTPKVPREAKAEPETTPQPPTETAPRTTDRVGNKYRDEDDDGVLDNPYLD